MLIENPKTYKGQEVETIFFRPSFCGKSAEELGVRVLYNMPVPTTVQVWSKPDNVLRRYVGGWTGGKKSHKLQRTINMHKVKAESSFAADDYFSMVFEQITGSAGVNMQDLSGTELEKAETELFRQSIVEGVRATMWIGDIGGDISALTTFDGFFKAVKTGIDAGEMASFEYLPEELETGVELFDRTWDASSVELKSLRSEGQLAYYVSSDVMLAYQKYLDAKGTDGAYHDTIDGRAQVCYHGIPVIEVPLEKYHDVLTFGHSFCMLTDRRNLVLALNTADMPENEVRMWYNPDEMENRQRAVFLAGADILDENLVTFAAGLVESLQ